MTSHSAIPFDFATYLYNLTGEKWAIHELSGGNANFVVRAVQIRSTRLAEVAQVDGKDHSLGKKLLQHNSVVLKQAPPYFAKFPSLNFSERRQTIEARALHFFQGNTPLSQALENNQFVNVPKLLHFDELKHVLIQSDLGPHPTLDIFLASPSTTTQAASIAGQTLGRFLASIHHAYDTSPEAFSPDGELVSAFDNDDNETAMCNVINNARTFMKDAGVPDFEDLGQRALQNWKRRERTAFSQGDIWFGTILVDTGADDPSQALVLKFATGSSQVPMNLLQTLLSLRVLSAFKSDLYAAYFAPLSHSPFDARGDTRAYQSSLLIMHGWELINAAAWRNQLWCGCPGVGVKCGHIKDMISEGVKLLRAGVRADELVDWDVVKGVEWVRYMKIQFNSVAHGDSEFKLTYVLYTCQAVELAPIPINSEVTHVVWTGDAPDVVHPPGLKFANLELVKEWTVKLEFHVEGVLTYGSGFFVNIPDTSYDVILTAAHNLISPTGKFSSNLTVLLADGSLMPVTDFRVSEAYKAKQTPMVDYGAILLPRPSTGARGGYPFNMKLAYEDSFKGDIYVSGYRVETPPGHPTTSSGRCVGCYAEQLEYKAVTEQGISGSPVWIEYQGLQTVIAIHNHRPEKARARTGGSRGSRLTPKLLRDVFAWASVGEYGVELRAQDPRSTPPLRRLYLNFSDDFAFARVRLGSGTKFDVLPVYATSEKALYAMTVGGKWVTFNVARKELVLTEKMRDGSLFKKANVKLKKKAMRIVLENEGISYQLRMQGTRIRERDGEDAESSEVSMVEYPLANNEMITEFWFELREQLKNVN
ncbi:hypothetical protein EW146_g693 [Bondarzewia mesenterica]|uniref:Serine protease n=1 Tax=Bondarzewia mesenterica TaxID=1095465 RepID=A0A4S4M651_9AGAM|nr:hypothetical protein EW146_g693 [Bondarzewia mesenterica]